MQLKYAIVELIAEKGSSDEIICGLLRGKGTVDGSNFVWAVTGNKIVRGCSLKHYNILSVVTFDGLTKTYTFFMADDDEQEQAFKIVEEAYEGLKELALEEGGTLLNVEKFENVPEDYGKITSVPARSVSSSNLTGAASVKTGVGATGDWYGKNHSSLYGGGYNSSYNADPEPHAWKRKTKKPTKKVLEELKEKLALIAKREYEFTAIAIKGEVESEKKRGRAASTMEPTDVDPYNDDDLPFCGCG